MAITPRPETPLDRPGALIAALPAVLGFVPERSLVLVTAADGEMGAVLRIDLESASTGQLARLAELAAASGADAAVAVIVDENGSVCRMCAEDHRETADLLADELETSGVTLLAAHVVDVVAAGGRWYCADGCGNSGLVEDPTASPIAVAAVLDGRRLYARRADLVEVVALVDPDHAQILAKVLTEAGDLDPDRPDAEVRADIERALDCAGQVDGGSALSDGQLAGLARSVTDPRVRDTLYALAVGDFAAAAEGLWAELSRRLPQPWRAEALVLLAFSAYARGDGPLAGIALDAALRVDPAHNMAGMLDRALQSGMRPEQIRELAHTGYRLAERLGLRLPPPRMFGRRAG
ncbi:DUF4192 domain-containing protein [Mycobacterium sp. Y57]|uniref:DUF4192 domain-containing protein n=1 Tax=Mycolicibacterium xanthum TaxID=2796469 RepID=UPI001C847B5D|nr:DUF4192 domain-containing protein [Mycolicibacterium xanthum]MBX7432757.1 DUF4192 domain-containing protein [Mycolicibacterium xanthum]